MLASGWTTRARARAMMACALGCGAAACAGPTRTVETRVVCPPLTLPAPAVLVAAGAELDAAEAAGVDVSDLERLIQAAREQWASVRACRDE